MDRWSIAPEAASLDIVRNRGSGRSCEDCRSDAGVVVGVMLIRGWWSVPCSAGPPMMQGGGNGVGLVRWSGAPGMPPLEDTVRNRPYATDTHTTKKSRFR
jgi:hypothetical protein